MQKDHRNVYAFNPSIVHLEGDMYLIVYRIIRYAFPVQIHPWKMWWDGDRLIKKYFGELPVDLKYRKGTDIGTSSVHFDDALPQIPDEQVEIDGTGGCLVRITHESGPAVQLLKNCSNVFGADQPFNHDCRVQWNGDALKLTYNGFVVHNGNRHVCMLTRDMRLDTQRNVCLTPDRYCSQNYSTFLKRAEKNWAFLSERKGGARDNAAHVYLYMLEPACATFVEERTGRMFQTPCDALKRLHQAYGDTLTFSLGTPCVRYGADGWLMVGHAKLDHVASARTHAASAFFRHLKASRGLRMHGKWVYLMYLMVLDKDLNVTHMSNAFIPTTEIESHLPYALVFPCGVHVDESSVIVSYGEGDVRCKLLFLGNDEVSRLLIHVDDIAPQNYHFYFMHKVPHKVLVLGRYGEGSSGDDCYRTILQTLLPKHLGTEYQLVFANPLALDASLVSDAQTVLVVPGGSGYFLHRASQIVRKLQGVRTILVSPRGHVVPQKDFTFSHVLTDKHDFPDLLHLLPEAIGTRTLDEPLPLALFRPGRVNVGMFLQSPSKAGRETTIRTYADAVRKLVSLNAHVFLVPLRVNPHDATNDCVVNDELVKMVASKHVTVVNGNHSDYVRYIDNIVSHLDAAVCDSYESHVLCLNRKVPLVSFSREQCVTELLQRVGLSPGSLDDLMSQKQQLPKRGINTSSCMQRLAACIMEN
jgi:predicted GH43/DUF377 family glycosyl hydrolase